MKEEILKILQLSDDYADKRKDRRKGSGGTQEFYTPTDLVSHMCDKVPEEQWKNPEADFLEPSFGNGQFVLMIIYRKIINGSTWKQALEHTYGVELMQDNVNETYNRVISLLKAMEIQDFNEDDAREIMKHNLVCSDFFKWDFENWCPIQEKKGSVELF